ncbi:hypothetical protein [Mucilaginibacter sp. KACC 22063]|uniref:hypothetical protein n=1 Tax=Mucilaginibacter sp. KACC 22063 TaxID=3025666 RepID=UPI002366D8C6|nr:hypothetical protein [Mucilaginibacter sp. KACC 22063]WDF57213.1 hypothetical protein PQ461_09120 [Mucilaginibacter sp. KACC 22063]
MPENHNNKRHRHRLFARIFLHAGWLVLLTIGLQYIPFTRPDEKDFLRWTAILRHNIFRHDQKGTDSVVFIDTSPDLALVSDTALKIDTVAPIHPPVKIITDRIKLAYLFNILNHHVNDYRYILLDIALTETSSMDKPLDSAIRKTPKLMASALFDDEEKKLTPPVFRVPYAPVAYSAMGGSLFYKMPVFYGDSLKSLPISLFEQLTNNRFTRKMGVVWLNGDPSFNYVIPEFYYRAANIVRDDGTRQKAINTYYLDQLINMGDDAMMFLKGKYIVIGNLSDDQHTTYIGKIPGPVLLWDIFLSLQDAPLLITWRWLLFLFLIFSFISAFLFLRMDRRLKKLEKDLPKIPWIKDIIVKYVSWLGVVILINLISTLLFKIVVSTFFIATYLTGFALAIEKHKKWLSTLKKLWEKFTALFNKAV